MRKRLKCTGPAYCNPVQNKSAVGFLKGASGLLGLNDLYAKSGSIRLKCEGEAQHTQDDVARHSSRTGDKIHSHA